MRTYIVLYTFTYAALGAFMPLIGQYLRFIEFSGAQIGSVVSVATAVAIFAYIFWGRLYNRSGNKKSFVLKLSLAAASVCACLYFVDSYAIFLPVFCVLYFFQAPAVSLIDAMALEDGQSFGAVRKWGALSFAFGVFFAGKFADISGLHVIFFLYSGCFFIVALNLLITDVGLKNTSDASSELGIFKNGKYIKMIICAFFISGVTISNNTYFGFLYLQGGGSIAGLGVAFLLMAGSEAPFMAWTEKIFNAFTLEKALLAAMCISTARFAWYATCPQAPLLMGFFILQGVTVGVTIVGFVKYVEKVVPRGHLGFAISVYYALSSGLSNIFCQMAGGVILDYLGAGGIYKFFAAMNLTGVILFVGWGLFRGMEKAKKK